MLYGGFTTVCVGAISMEAPKELWPDGQPPVSPAVACTMNLSMQYFAVYLAIAVLQTWEQFNSVTPETRKLGGILQLATNTVNFAPMLCILFMVFSALRYLLMLALYGGFTAVIVSVFLIEAKEGPTPPVSPTMQCVMNLTVQFFFVYLLLWVLLTLRQLAVTYNVRSYDGLFATLIPTLDAAKATVQFCPMVAILFVGMRMRALQITSQQGAPQGYAQQAMFLSTYAVMTQVLMVLLMPLFVGGAPKVDEDGNVIVPAGNSVLMYVTTTIRYLALVALYGGAVTVVVALFEITPETATGSGSLVPGVEIPVPPSPPTPE